MKLTGFFKLPKNREFNYTPRYYDERKEDLERRVAMKKRELGVDTGETGYTSNIRGQFRSQFDRQRKQKQKMLLLRRMIIIGTVIVLIIAVYLVINLTSLMISNA